MKNALKLFALIEYGCRIHVYARQARQIESHFKRMKSATYVRNLATYPEIIEKRKQKYC